MCLGRAISDFTISMDEHCFRALTPDTDAVVPLMSFFGVQKVAMGHDVHVACRTEAKAKAAAEKSGAAGAFACDLSSLESVRSFADAWGGKPIDTLCLNAGKPGAAGGEQGGCDDARVFGVFP